MVRAIVLLKARRERPHKTLQKNRHAGIQPPLGLRPLGSRMPAAQVAEFCAASWLVFTPPLTSRDIVEDFVSALWCEDKDLQVFAAQTWKFAEKYFELPQGRREIIGTNRDLGSPRNTTIVLTTRIQLHYWQNNAFIENSQMFEGRNDTFPIKLVHGQLDFVCPLSFARRANEKLPNSSLRIVPLAGHAFDDKALLSALREEIDQMAIELEGSEVK